MQLKTVEIVYRSQIELFHSNKAGGGTGKKRRCFFCSKGLVTDKCRTMGSEEPGYEFSISVLEGLWNCDFNYSL